MKSGVLTGFTIVYGGPIKVLGEGRFPDSAGSSAPAGAVSLSYPTACVTLGPPRCGQRSAHSRRVPAALCPKGLRVSLEAWIPRSNLSREKTGPFLSGTGGTPAVVPALGAEALGPPQQALSVVS